MSTRDRVLLAFHNRPDRALSGASLAKELGLSRAAIWKQVQTLRHQGIPIQSQSKTGYRLSGPSDFSLTHFKCPRSLQGWLKVHYEISTASTQRLAKTGAQAGLPEGHLWVSEIQSAGRGRLARVWESPFGGLWFSLLLRPSLPAGKVPPLTLVAALALAESAGELIGQNIYLKWPNDLVVWRQNRWKKVAGILTEMSGETDRTEWVVMGIGANVNNSIPSNLKDKAIALRELDDASPLEKGESGGISPWGRIPPNLPFAKGGAFKLIPRAKLLSLFLQKFKPLYLDFQRRGFAPFQNRYWARYGQANRTVRIQTSGGEIQGIARGVDPVGMLIIESRRKMVHISEGEIVL